MDNEQIITAERVFEIIKPRDKDVNKADCGRLLNIAGSLSFTGAALLSTAAALKGGCGYVYLASPQKVVDRIICRVPEAVFVNVLENETGGTEAKSAIKQIKALADKLNAVAAGSGMGNTKDTAEIIKYLAWETDIPAVIDADGLNALSENPEILMNTNEARKASLVLTPHIGEFARLVDKSKNEIKQNTKKLIAEFTEKHAVTLLLKGSVSYIAQKNKPLLICNCGTPGLAKAGSGDVLTGLTGALLASGLCPYDAALCGAFIHACAGTLAAKSRSVRAMTASDVIEEIGKVFLQYNR